MCGIVSGLVGHRGKASDVVNDVNKFSGLVRSSSHTFANTRGHSATTTTSCAELPMCSYHSGLLVAKLLYALLKLC